MADDHRRRTGSSHADLVLRGGTVLSLDEVGTVHDSLAVRSSEIVALGEDVAPLIGPTTSIMDLHGRTVLPGINDAHLHAAWLGARWPRLFFADHSDDHSADGKLVETEQERRAALLRAWSLLAELGITSYTEPGIGPGEDDGETGCFGSAMLATYIDLHRERRQTSRVTLLRLFGTLDGETTLDAFQRGIRAPAPQSDPRWLAIPGVKIFADGIPPMRTAWVREPYSDGSTGSILTRGGSSPLDAFQRMIRSAESAGLQIAVHATGDRAIDEFLRALEQSGAGRRRHPHYVVHGDLVSEDLLVRLRRANVGIAMQPLIAAHTHAWASAELGQERIRHAWPLGDSMAMGVATTITSDAPIAHPDWRRSLDAALAMLGDSDTREMRQQLLRAVTAMPAAQDGAAGWKGTLELGKAADLTVLDADPTQPGRAFRHLRIDCTIVDGRLVYERGITPPVEATTNPTPASRA